MPDTLLVGIERVPEALIIGMERAAREGIPNIRYLVGDASSLSGIFAPGEADRVYINFCDPWPNNGHKKRRLTHERFLSIYKDLLRPGGEIHFKTDNDALFEFSLGQFEESGFELLDVTRDLHACGPVGVMTDYELKFYGQGVSINRCVARIK
jgi:tRNA (guanine-N7-)-methyltransferase